MTEIHGKSDEISRGLVPVLAAEKLIVQSTNLTSLFNRLNMSFGRGESETIALAWDRWEKSIYEVPKIFKKKVPCHKNL